MDEGRGGMGAESQWGGQAVRLCSGGYSSARLEVPLEGVECALEL